jgi:hypothetical protein
MLSKLPKSKKDFLSGFYWLRYGKFTERLIFPFSLSARQPFFVLSAVPLAEASLVSLNMKTDMTSIGLKLRPTDKTFGFLPQICHISTNKIRKENSFWILVV